MRNMLLFLCLLCIVPGYAQVKTTKIEHPDVFRINQALSASTLDAIPLKIMPFVDVEKLLEEDAELEGLDVPLNIGYLFDVNYTLEDGIWEETPYAKIWRMRIRSNGAYMLNFTFSKLNLAPGAELYIYNRSGTMVYGPATAEEIISNYVFVTDLLSGDESIIELNEPLSVSQPSEINITKVAHGYIDLFSTTYDFETGKADPCNKNILDYPEWMGHGTAVGHIVFQKADKTQSACTGSLINNTAQDKKGYFLSAFHCVDNETNPHTPGELSQTELARLNSWLVRFNYLPNNTNISVSGAVFKAGWADTDFILVELGNPTMGFDDLPVSWLGWTRSSTSPTKAIGIHHPQADYKKISFANSSVPISYYTIPWTNGVTTPGYSHWDPHFDIGGTEPGSSGSPILNQNGLIFGQLHGGHGKICGGTTYYGRFDLSWEGGGTPDTRLKDWLDPRGTNATTLDKLCRHTTFQITGNIWQTGCTPSVSALNLSGINTVCGSNLPVSVRFSTNRDLVYIKSASTVTNVKLTKTAIRNYTLDFQLWYGAGSVTLTDGCYTYELKFQAPLSYSYNYTPEGRNVVIDFDSDQPTRHKISFVNISGAVVKTVETQDHRTEINVSNLNNGLYYMTIYNNTNQVVGTEKIMVTNK